MNSVNLVFPHQLFEESPLIDNGFPVYLVEEFLYFKQYPFHKQKIAFHRATMKFYETYLRQKGVDVTYIPAITETSDIRELLPVLAEKKIAEIRYIDTVDDWLERRIQKAAKVHGIAVTTYETPLFLNTREELSYFFKPEKKKFHQTSFYTAERKKRNILMTPEGKPEGGKWTFDTENRKKYPRKKVPPSIQYPDNSSHYEEAQTYVKEHFQEHYGELTEQPLYPITYQQSYAWLNQFLEQRFMEFGAFEDAIVSDHTILNHSVLTPMLNVGLITPDTVVEKSLLFATEHGIPINSTEGFIRQIIGWREFIRGIYVTKGRYERTRHFWNFTKKIPKSFYTGTTGIPPIDKTIKKVWRTGYCHHIERLMVLGSFMVLCEFDPDEVYQWFMEMFIDAYDWVMVPNVYGMSQFADGGLMSTKPYISGSNYLMKMSDYGKGAWQDTWDGLFWRFMHTHRDFFLANPRLGMLVRTFDRMPEEKKHQHLHHAEAFLDQLTVSP